MSDATVYECVSLFLFSVSDAAVYECVSLFRFSVSDAAVYECVSTNSLGMHSASARVYGKNFTNVFAKNKFTEKFTKSFNSIFTNQNKLNETIFFVRHNKLCTARGMPL